ncbi:SpoIIE family protein phosphatase [Mangrovicoccus sp. HB161399]|uniref:SpoIIE family protein phosphatase n=1 Tax=Mangrovicoccus sp. HB161399 TaxID=2720392 RepID=UPI0015537C88|nr:SpoIIE family protein phosphatase [Mangrovicoccus sp. HB161399]
MEISVAQGLIPCSGGPGGLGWGVASKPKIRGQASGDGYLLRWLEGCLLAAVVDGAGSGREAAAAADACIAALGGRIGSDLIQIFAACHAALIGTRGAALGLALIDPGDCRVIWAAVGDVDAVLVSPDTSDEPRRQAIIKRGGTLGSTAIRPLVQRHRFVPGDVLVLVTDGISRGFADRIDRRLPPGQIAHALVRGSAFPADDSLALVLRLGDAR